ncbi:MAG: hypothetical protein ACRYG4_04275 [Janthinobacterium lividum]
MSMGEAKARLIADLAEKAANDAKATIHRTVNLLDDPHDRLAVLVIATALLANSLEPVMMLSASHRDLRDRVMRTGWKG